MTAPLDPIPFASRSMKFVAVDEMLNTPDRAYVGLHDPLDGQMLASCQMPCDIKLDPNRDYVVSAAATGYTPDIIQISPRSLSDDRPVTIYMGHDHLAHIEKAITCYEDYVSAGKPDQDATLCSRFPPKMPGKAMRSGHCKMMFDVSETGWLINIRVLSCTDDVFRTASERSLEGWYYTPKTQRGQAVKQTNIESRVSFRLRDENGVLIDEDGRLVMDE